MFFECCAAPRRENCVCGRFKVLRVKHEEAGISRRLLCLGLVPGVMIEVLRAAPLGDPLEIRCQGYNLALRREELSLLDLERIVD